MPVQDALGELIKTLPVEKVNIDEDTGEIDVGQIHKKGEEEEGEDVDVPLPAATADDSEMGEQQKAPSEMAESEGSGLGFSRNLWNTSKGAYLVHFPPPNGDDDVVKLMMNEDSMVETAREFDIDIDLFD